MTDTTTDTDTPPSDQIAALRWLLDRHPDVERLLTRIHPDPLEAAFLVPDAWREPDSDAASVVGPMSGGEVRVVRAIAFLTGRVAIGVTDLYGIDFARSRTNFSTDWVRCVAVGMGRW